MIVKEKDITNPFPHHQMIIPHFQTIRAFKARNLSFALLIMGESGRRKRDYGERSYDASWGLISAIDPLISIDSVSTYAVYYYFYLRTSQGGSRAGNLRNGAGDRKEEEIEEMQSRRL